MRLEVHQPTGQLANYIDTLVFYSDYTPDYTHERLLPDGRQTLIIDLTEQPKCIFDNESLSEIQTCRKAWLSGSRNRLLTIDAGGINSSMMIVNFKYGAAYHFTRIPMQELTSQVVDTDLIFNTYFLELRERLLGIAEPSTLFTLTEDYFLGLLKDEEIPDYVLTATQCIAADPSGRTMEDLARLSGYSQKHSIDVFKKYVGLSPKAFQKIQRFQKVVRELEKTHTVNWTRLALDCGYFDQAHFIKEFKSFSGFNPARYLVEKGSEMNYVPVRTNR